MSDPRQIRVLFAMRTIAGVENLDDGLLREGCLPDRAVTPMLGDLLLQFFGALAVVFREHLVPFVRRCEELLEKIRQLRSRRFLPDSETRAVVKCPRSAALLQFRPDFSHGELLRAQIDIVQKQDAAGPDFRQPRFEIMTNGCFGMKAVEMENIDALRLEGIERFVEGRAEESGEALVILSIVRGDLCKRRLIVITRMLISAPRIDAKTASARFIFLGRLAEGEVAFAAIDSQFHEQAGPECCHQIVSEMQMAGPRANSVNPRFEVARRQIYVDNFRSHAGRRG